MLEQLNYVAIIVAAVVSMAIGFLWYSPSMFGKQWRKLMGIKKKDMKKMEKKGKQSMIWAFISIIVTAGVLSLIIKWLGLNTWQAGANIGFWIWLGFVATSQLGIVLWEGKPLKLYLINAGHHLVSLAVMGAILAAWV